MDKEKIIYSVVKRIDKGEGIKHSDYEIDIKDFGDIVDMIIDEGLIKGADVRRGGQGNHALAVFLKDAKITMKGLRFLKEESALDGKVTIHEKQATDEEDDDDDNDGPGFYGR